MEDWKKCSHFHKHVSDSKLLYGFDVIPVKNLNGLVTKLNKTWDLNEERNFGPIPFRRLQSVLSRIADILLKKNQVRGIILLDKKVRCEA